MKNTVDSAHHRPCYKRHPGITYLSSGRFKLLCVAYRNTPDITDKFSRPDIIGTQRLRIAVTTLVIKNRLMTMFTMPF